MWGVKIVFKKIFYLFWIVNMCVKVIVVLINNIDNIKLFVYVY